MHVFKCFLLFIVSILVRQSRSKCAGGFDIYFILDKSRSLSRQNFQNQTVGFVSEMIEQLNSPKTRISLITFSETATLHLPLTNNRDKIQDGLDRLKRITPNGRTYLMRGLDKALTQIKEKGQYTASIVIITTDGELSGGGESFRKADFLRNQLSATIFAIGIANYKYSQLRKLASKPTTDYVYTATHFNKLYVIGEKIVDTACIEVTRVEPATVCVGKPYQITIYGKGFTKTLDQSQITCNFKYNNTVDHVTKPIQISDAQLKCQAPVLESVQSYVSLQVSLTVNKFISTDIRVIGVSCVRSDPTKAILLTLLVLVLLSLLALWWFYLLLPCINHTQKPPATEPAAKSAPVERGSKKWPTVDASFYGGVGVGGIKPVKVSWGEKGATDEGNKLIQTPDANVIDPGDDDPAGGSIASPATSSPTLSERTAMLINRLKRGLAFLGSLVLMHYQKVASARPQKGGQSKFYSNRSERKSLALIG